ncbi:hypothetical protein H6G81_17660 [Scytonema hofmannii FACHB-248]|uniref:Uncharacterized protein n=1 Tax=Scytonema hofmannii FACHB-248 TaxID=1842502 RepID=A0ABR8GTQ2_9CYAN|nr:MULTISPECIES: hypothetical protein [Nostocales]MBD2606306.1 hypothetical protein [Scytonema hofmannii FACHB-248]
MLVEKPNDGRSPNTSGKTSGGKGIMSVTSKCSNSLLRLHPLALSMPVRIAVITTGNRMKGIS